jgi:RND family efflux transporter MFP subunit
MNVPMMAEPIGTTKALQEVSIRARVRGYLKEMHFREGGDVKKGQLLFVIDEAGFKAELAAARAKLELAEASLKKSQDSKAREVATAQLAVSRAMLELAVVEERRQQALLTRKASSIDDVQHKQALRKRDAAQVESSLASLDQAKADYETSILAARADVAEAKAGIVSAEIDLSYCRLSAPIDGRIGLAQVKLGNLVGPATSGDASDYTELAVIRQLDPMGVDMQVASRHLDRVTRLVVQGLPVEVYRPGLEGEEARHFPGKATVVDNTIDATTSTFRVQAEVPNPQKTMLPGEYVKADVKVGEVQDAVVVPEQAVIETQAGPSVYTVDSQGKVAVAMVKASFIYQGLRVLESGIEPGQKVITEGLQFVRGGMTVKAEPASPEALSAADPGPVAKEGHTNGKTLNKAVGKP